MHRDRQANVSTEWKLENGRPPTPLRKHLEHFRSGLSWWQRELKVIKGDLCPAVEQWKLNKKLVWHKTEVTCRIKLPSNRYGLFWLLFYVCTFFDILNCVRALQSSCSLQYSPNVGILYYTIYSVIGVSQCIVALENFKKKWHSNILNVYLYVFWIESWKMFGFILW